jgi:hypothetical protein
VSPSASAIWGRTGTSAGVELRGGRGPRELLDEPAGVDEAGAQGTDQRAGRFGRVQHGDRSSRLDAHDGVGIGEQGLELRAGGHPQQAEEPGGATADIAVVIRQGLEQRVVEARVPCRRDEQ